MLAEREENDETNPISYNPQGINRLQRGRKAVLRSRSGALLTKASDAAERAFNAAFRDSSSVGAVLGKHRSRGGTK